MKTMRLLTADLKAAQLDWALAVALGAKPVIESFENNSDKQLIVGWNRRIINHKDPAFCLKVCLDYRLVVSYEFPSARTQTSKVFIGDTPQEAVARCVVAMRLGDEVDVPDELCGVQS